MEEKPLRLFKQLEKEGKKPMFMLDKLPVTEAEDEASLEKAERPDVCKQSAVRLAYYRGVLRCYLRQFPAEQQVRIMGSRDAGGGSPRLRVLSSSSLLELCEAVAREIVRRMSPAAPFAARDIKVASSKREAALMSSGKEQKVCPASVRRKPGNWEEAVRRLGTSSEARFVVLAASALAEAERRIAVGTLTDECNVEMDGMEDLMWLSDWEPSLD